MAVPVVAAALMAEQAVETLYGQIQIPAAVAVLMVEAVVRPITQAQVTLAAEPLD
jgi:hypothetical protein